MKIENLKKRAFICFGKFRYLRSIWAILSYALTASSIISLIQRIGDIALAEVFKKTLEIYRLIPDSLFFVFLEWWSPINVFGIEIIIPRFLADIIVIWFLMGSISLRVESLNLRLLFEDESPFKIWHIVIIYLFSLLSLFRKSLNYIRSIMKNYMATLMATVSAQS